MGQLNEFGQAGQIKETSIECYGGFPYIESKSHTLQNPACRSILYCLPWFSITLSLEVLEVEYRGPLCIDYSVTSIKRIFLVVDFGEFVIFSSPIPNIAL